MNKRLNKKSILGIFALALLAACGGGEDEEDQTLSNTQALWGTYYSASTNAVWQFASNAAQGGRYKGLLYQGSTDGSACRITELDYSVNSSGSTVTYYITRAVGTGTNNVYDSGSIYDGPYSASYTRTSNGVTIGAGTYTKMSQRTFKPNGCR